MNPSTNTPRFSFVLPPSRLKRWLAAISAVLLAALGASAVGPAAQAAPKEASATVFSVPGWDYANLRTGPGLDYTEVGTAVAGSSVTIGCWTLGGSATGPYGTSDLWYSVAGIGGTYIADVMIFTGSDEPVTEQCSQTPTAADSTSLTQVEAPAVLAASASGSGSYQSSASDLMDAVGCAQVLGLDCFHAQDAKTWAVAVAEWRFSDLDQHNTAADAFRHCAWMGALSTRVGESKAIEVGNIHENNSRGPEDERAMDLGNNRIGSHIGAQAVIRQPKDQWGYVLKACESQARAGQLNGLNGVKGNY